jgi:hypothetical protein
MPPATVDTTLESQWFMLQSQTLPLAGNGVTVRGAGIVVTS